MSIEKFREAQDAVTLKLKAPHMLKVLRAIHLLVSRRVVLQLDIQEIRRLVTLALAGTEDITE